MSDPEVYAVYSQAGQAVRYVKVAAFGQHRVGIGAGCGANTDAAILLAQGDVRHPAGSG